MDRWVARLGVLIVVVLLAPQAALGSTTVDLRGTYVGTSQANGSNYSIGSVVVTEDCAAGTFSGHGVSNGQTYSNFTGTITGDINSNHITEHEVYTNVNYTADGVDSASLDGQGRLRIQGTFTDSYGHSGTADSTRVSGPPNDGGCGGQTSTSTSSSSTSTSTKAPSATSVQCNYDNFMQSFSCTAQVGDASGTQPPRTPTGTVEFALDPGADGSFPQGSTCTLQSSQRGPTAYCSVTYFPGQQGVPAGTQPRLSATYSGDSRFAPSSGRPTNRYGPVDFGPSDATSTSTSSTTTSTSTSSTTTSTRSTTTTSTTPPSCRVSPARAVRAFRAAQRSPAAIRTAGGHAPRNARTISRAQADRRSINRLHPSRTPLTNGVALYGLSRPLTAGSRITEARLGSPRALLPTLLVKERAWLYWEDLAPLERFMHPSVVLVIAAKGGRVLAHAKLVTFPQVNGRTPSFITSRKPRVIYRRWPGRRHPIRLSRAELRRLRSTLAVARSRKALAHISDVSRSTLITVVNHGSHDVGDTFLNEEQAITGVFASHGIATRSVDLLTQQNIHLGPRAALMSEVDDAAAAGKTNVTLYLDGHGLSTRSSDEAMVLAGPSVTALDLTAITQAHPEIKFNFIIDACYSGRFVNPLSAEPNVVSVTTSSGAQEQSLGPSLLTTTPNPGYSPAEFVGPLPEGQHVYIAGNADPAAVSSFTAAEVAALGRAFAGQGADPDVNSVIGDARRLEPTFDLAAEAGFTHPSPDPNSAGASCEQPSGMPDPSPPDDWFTGA